MRMKVVTVVKMAGVGKESKQAYDFWRVGGLVHTHRGVEFAEVMIDGTHPQPQGDQSYELELEAYPDREKRLVIKVANLRPVAVAAEAPKRAA